MSNDIKASGNFNFDNNKNVAKTDYSTKNLKKVGANLKDLFKDGSKVNIKDGINAEEAKSIIVELEDLNILDDDTITRKEVKKFMKSLGMKTGKGTTKAIQSASKGNSAKTVAKEAAKAAGNGFSRCLSFRL